jgi:hypothetical protein
MRGNGAVGPPPETSTILPPICSCIIRTAALQHRTPPSRRRCWTRLDPLIPIDILDQAHRAAYTTVTHEDIDTLVDAARNFEYVVHVWCGEHVRRKGDHSLPTIHGQLFLFALYCFEFGRVENEMRFVPDKATCHSLSETAIGASNDQHYTTARLHDDTVPKVRDPGRRA